MKQSKKIRIGFDLDGVLVDKPPFIPKRLLEFLYRGKLNHKISYRFPKTQLEIFVRKLSHLPFLRGPIKKNLETIRKLYKNKNVDLYVISGRYSFLKERTDKWMKYYNTEKLFKQVYINELDSQPHIFKKSLVSKLKLDYYFDDDPLVTEYLTKERINVKVHDIKDLHLVLSKFIKLKVLLGISYYSPNISGLTIYAKTLAEELVDNNFEVKVITSQHIKSLDNREVVNGVEVKRIWTPIILGRGAIMPTYPIDSFFAVKESDIVNIHIPSVEGLFLAMWGKLLGKKIIVTHHCDLSNWKGLLNQISERLVLLSLHVISLLSDNIVVYTKDYANHSPFLKKYESKLLYQLPPVKLNETNSSQINIKIKSKYKIGFAGRISKEKGIEVLLNAIPELKKRLGSDFKILIAGPSEEVIGGGNIGDLRALLDLYKDNVVLLGSIRPENMSSFYKAIDVLVLPSTEKIESFGFVQVEAMLNKIPVVASNLPGVRMPIKLTNMGKVVIPDNSIDLVHSISDVLKNKKKYIKDQNVIREIFNYKNTIDFYIKIFRS